LTITNQFTQGDFVSGNGNGASGGLFFNLNPNYNPANLSLSLGAASGGTRPMVSLGTDMFKADGDGKYDIQIDFAGNNFVAGDSITYTITDPGLAHPLSAADFAYLSKPAGGSGPFYAAAHVQGLSGGNSTWIEPGGGPMAIVTAAPEPRSIAYGLLALALGGLLIARRSRA
jgi:hypothetical protein